jgi:tRNA threonylcarbamoyladenosine biosynthesis protein TsaB
MILLVTDTSGKHGCVGLARTDERVANETEVIEEAPLAGGTFSAQLVPQIAALLTKHGISKTEIGAFIVVSGPGSFTGLRVGLAAIKALAEALQKPIVPVSLLEVVACATETSSESQRNVLAALDAGRGEVYAGEYELVGNNARGVTARIINAKLIQERLLPKNEFLSLAQQTVVATPDAGLVEILRRAGVRVFSISPPGTEMIAKVGWRKLRAGGIVSPEQLEANYIRCSDAEIFANPVSGS